MGLSKSSISISIHPAEVTVKPVHIFDMHTRKLADEAVCRLHITAYDLYLPRPSIVSSEVSSHLSFFPTSILRKYLVLVRFVTVHSLLYAQRCVSRSFPPLGLYLLHVKDQLFARGGWEAQTLGLAPTVIRPLLPILFLTIMVTITMVVTVGMGTIAILKLWRRFPQVPCRQQSSLPFPQRLPPAHQ